MRNCDWEQRKLSDIVKLFGGYAFSSADSNSYGIPWLKIANVGKNGIDWSSASYLPDNFWLDYEDFRLFTGDYVMALTRPIISHALKIAVVDKNALLNQRVAKLIFDTNEEYGFQLLQRRTVVDRIESELAGTDPPNLGSGNLKNITISITSNNNEQSKIGIFFKKLDDTIALHQQKQRQIRSLKQGFIKNLFPNNKNSAPRIRFAIFNDDWNQRNASEIFTSVSDKNYPELPVLSASQEKGMVLRESNGIDIKYDQKSTGTYKRVLPGQFVMHLRSFQGGFAYSTIEGITSPAYTILAFRNKEDHYPLFWKSIFSSKNFIKRLEAITYGIRDGRSISYADFSTLRFWIPSYEEQKQIGDFIESIDATIVFYQRQIDMMQSLKKELLNKMFI